MNQYGAALPNILPKAAPVAIASDSWAGVAVIALVVAFMLGLAWLGSRCDCCGKCR